MQVGQRFNPHRMFDGVFIPEAICQYRGISPGAKLVYGRFCRFAGKNGEVFPSMATLGKEIGCSGSQAKRYVRELEDDHFVEVEEDPGRPNTYYFLWHSAFDGDVGMVRFAPTPREDPTGVPETDTPVGCYRGPREDATGGPREDPTDEESHRRESRRESPAAHQRNGAIDYKTGEPLFDQQPRKKLPRFGGRPDAPPTSGSSRLRAMREAGASWPPPTGAPPHANGHSAAPDANHGDYIQRWNRVVASAPAKWNEREDGHLLREALVDPEFTENFDEICAKAEEVNTTSDIGAWLDFHTLLSKNKHGQHHWHLVYVGKYRKRLKKTTSPEDGADPVALAAKNRKEREEREKAKAERKAARAAERAEKENAGAAR